VTGGFDAGLRLKIRNAFASLDEKEWARALKLHNEHQEPLKVVWKWMCENNGKVTEEELERVRGQFLSLRHPQARATAIQHSPLFPPQS
jgi:hypothetical protein